MTAATITRIESFLARLVMLAMAVGTVYLGYAVLTRPLAIPLAIGLWLGATGMAFLGVWGRLPESSDLPHERVRP